MNVSDCRCQGMIIPQQGHTNWDLFKSLTSKLLTIIRQHHQQQTTVSTGIAAINDPNVAEVVSWLKDLSLTEQADIAQQTQLTFMMLSAALSDQTAMQQLLQSLKLSDSNTKMFKTKLMSKMLSQSIEGWLIELNKGHYYDKLKENGCSTFEELFNAGSDPELFAMVTEGAGIKGVQSKLFAKQVKSKREEMLGATKKPAMFARCLC